MGKFPNRDESLALLNEYNKEEHLIKHALSVEGVMKYFARLYNEDEEKWGIVGLLHDLDYGMYPEEHCSKVIEIMEEKKLDKDLIRAVVSHGYGLVCDVKPESNMEKVLYTVDELTGLISATAIMRPSKSVMDLELKSKGFAEGVNREVIKNGAEMLGMNLDDVINNTILGMREVAEDIGLKGNL